ncbi:MAG TPA: enoyl-CoA hydratase-related protein [Rugosimonospora sp.]|nr:enoyl-CoA hydratase-related protein [Rugosimonospora sp.]
MSLVLDRRGPVLVVRLDRPEARNALTPELMSGVGAAVLDAESDVDIRVLVLTGTGDRAFCAGMDLRAFASGADFDSGDAGTAAYHRLARGEVSVPVVGAANGAAIGGGLELLLGCDVVVASEQASFGFPEVKRGLFPAGGGTAIGTRIPVAVALEMVLTGDPVGAARAYQLGLVNSVVPPGEVLDAALAYAGRIAANAPLGLAAAKNLVRLGVTDAARAATRLAEWQATVFASDDAKEGAAAFMAKRPPVWTGR